MIPQGTREWHLQRLGMVTASRFSECKTPKSKTAERYMADLIGEMLSGEPADDLDTPDLRHGRKYEPFAVEAYEKQTGIKVERPGLIYHPEHRYVAGSPDGLLGTDGVLEIKCPRKSGIHMLTVLSGKMPDEHLWQVQGNLWITGRQWADFVSYDPRVVAECQLFVVRVPRDTVFIKELADVVIQFRDQMLQKIQKLSKEKTHG